jgi:hypothetical protein
MIYFDALFAGAPDAKPVADAPPRLMVACRGRNQALQGAVRDRFVKCGKIKMGYPGMTGIQVPLKLKLEFKVGSSPVQEKKYGTGAGLQTITEDLSQFDLTSTFSKMFGELICQSLENDLVFHR